MEFFKTKSDKDGLFLDGFCYRRKRLNKNGSIHWVCLKDRMKKCTGALVTRGETVERKINHVCLPNKEQFVVQKQLEKCKKRVREEIDVPVCKIFKEEIQKCLDQGLDIKAIPTYENRKGSLNLLRRRTLGVSYAPPSVDFEIPKNLMSFEDDNKFLFHDSTENKKRILVFSHPSLKSIIQDSDTLFLDGTFGSCCKLFDQLYTIHADLGSNVSCTNVAPVMFALLPDKTERTYERLFTILKLFCENLPPKSFMVDFEAVVIKILKNLFPTSKVKGCNYHFNQSIWRKIQGLELTEKYRNEEDTKLHIRQLTALADISEDCVLEGFLKLMEQSPNYDMIFQLNDYYVNQWLDNDYLPIEVCNCYRLRHRPNNVVEGWHTTFNKQIGRKRFNVFKLVEELKKEIQNSVLCSETNHLQKTMKIEDINEDDKLKTILHNFMLKEMSESD